MAEPRHELRSPRLEDAVQCPLLERELEQWVRCCTCRFLPLARRVARDDDLARDALQESWIIVLKKLHQYRGGSPACGWVGAIVRHEALRGATAWRRELPLESDSHHAEGSTARHAGPPGAALDSPEADTAARELIRLLLGIIDDLPPTSREVVRLRDIEDRPTEEVARHLHISTQNVRVRLHRAHRLLRPRFLRLLSAPAAKIPQKNCNASPPRTLFQE